MRFYDAELYRLRGEFRVLAGETGGARADFEQALNIARQQGALSLELKAAVSLARLWKSEGKIEEAHELLSTVYDTFTEGFDTHDLRTTKATLETLSD